MTPKPPESTHTVLLVQNPAGHSHLEKIATGKSVEIISKIGKFTVVRVDDPKLNDYNLWSVREVIVYNGIKPIKKFKCAEGTYLEVMVKVSDLVDTPKLIGTKVHEMIETHMADKPEPLPGPLVSYTVENGNIVASVPHHTADWGVIPNSKTQSMFEMIQEYKKKYLELSNKYSIKGDELKFSNLGKPETVMPPWVTVGSADEKVTVNLTALDPWVVYDGAKDVYYLDGKAYRFKYIASEIMYYVKKENNGPWLSLADSPLAYLNSIAREVRKSNGAKGFTNYETKPVITRINAINGYVVSMYKNNKYYEATITGPGDVEGLSDEFPLIFTKRVKQLIRTHFIDYNSDPERFWYDQDADHVKAIEKEYKYPVKDSPYFNRMMSLKQIIISLNDSDMWSREAIADWLDTLDEQPVFYPQAQEPTRRVVNTARVVTLEPHLQKENPKSGQ